MKSNHKHNWDYNCSMLFRLQLAAEGHDGVFAMTLVILISRGEGYQGRGGRGVMVIKITLPAFKLKSSRHGEAAGPDAWFPEYGTTGVFTSLTTWTTARLTDNSGLTRRVICPPNSPIKWT